MFFHIIIIFVFGGIPTITIYLGSDYDSVVRIERLYLFCRKINKKILPSLFRVGVYGYYNRPRTLYRIFLDRPSFTRISLGVTILSDEMIYIVRIIGFAYDAIALTLQYSELSSLCEYYIGFSNYIKLLFANERGLERYKGGYPIVINIHRTHQILVPGTIEYSIVLIWGILVFKEGLVKKICYYFIIGYTAITSNKLRLDTGDRLALKIKPEVKLKVST